MVNKAFFIKNRHMFVDDLVKDGSKPLFSPLHLFGSSAFFDVTVKLGKEF